MIAGTDDVRTRATYYRTALLLGLIHGETVRRWADQVIERDPEPPAPLFEIASVSDGDLSALRHALWPLVEEPVPPAVLQSIFALLRADLESNRRGLRDTLTILRQMRSMLRLPPDVYADLNAALVAHAAEPAGNALLRWLSRFAQSAVPW